MTSSFIVPGVTGFWRAGDVPLQSIPRAEYAAAPLRFVSPPDVLAGLAANHHWLPLDDGRVVLGHRHLRIVGCIEQPATALDLDWAFLDPPPEMAACGTLLSARAASASTSDLDLGVLPEVERQQIEYWEPATLGELVFHRWD